ncbi:MAG: GNAT family N-acetyltransferase [Oscillospiraceae bacterium]|nr:GNAT family N-acetyltransferase [Oscillospiraceae bacterium]
MDTYIRAGGLLTRTPEQLRLELKSCLSHPDDFVLGVWEDGVLRGVFPVFSEPEERYLELLAALSGEETVCMAVLDRLQQTHDGFSLDCVLHPDQAPMRSALRRAGAAFEPVQRMLRLQRFFPAPPDQRVSRLNPEHQEEYRALHNRDCYWTANRILQQPELFSVFIALKEGTVCGYLDCTHHRAENEIYDLFVREDCRRTGLGRALLAAALRENAPAGMIALTKEGSPAEALFRTAGFTDEENGRSITAHLKLKAASTAFSSDGWEE